MYVAPHDGPLLVEELLNYLTPVDLSYTTLRSPR
jgi:hypothetical protein